MLVFSSRNKDLGLHHHQEKAKGKTEELLNLQRGQVPTPSGVTFTNDMVTRPSGVSTIPIAVVDHLLVLKLDPGARHVTVLVTPLTLAMLLLFVFLVKERERIKELRVIMAIGLGKAKTFRLAMLQTRLPQYYTTYLLLLHPKSGGKIKNWAQLSWNQSPTPIT
jgi:hypothetical protein